MPQNESGSGPAQKPGGSWNGTSHLAKIVGTVPGLQCRAKRGSHRAPPFHLVPEVAFSLSPLNATERRRPSLIGNEMAVPVPGIGALLKELHGCAAPAKVDT